MDMFEDSENKVKIEFIEPFRTTIKEENRSVGRTTIVSENEYKLTEVYAFQSYIEFEDTELRSAEQEPSEPSPATSTRPILSAIPIPASSSIQNLNVNTDSRSEKRALQFECNVCRYKTKHNSHMKCHLLRHSNSRNFACNQCPKKFYSTTKLRDHMRVHSGEKPYICDICSVGFAVRSNLVQHIRLHIKKSNIKNLPTYVCYICGDGVKYQRKCYLDVHMRQYHIGGTPYSCNICSKQFWSETGLVTHMKVHNTNATPSGPASKNAAAKMYKCSQCDYSTKYNSHLKAHSRIHSGEKPYKCGLCPAAFRDSSHLRRHQRALHASQHLKCNECSKMFSEKSNLTLHIRTKHGEFPVPKKFKCQICGLRSVCKANLRKHLLVHTKEKPFKCPNCSKGFSLKGNMERHVNTVRNCGAYECYVCTKPFYQLKMLKSHFGRHTGDKRFKCANCLVVFRTKEALAQHVGNVKCGPFNCSNCSKVFKTKRNLNQHTKTVKCQRRVDKNVSGKRLTKKLRCFDCEFESTFEQSLMHHIKQMHEISTWCSLKIKKIR